nr:MAG TPA: hypothetical protein [Caudoviricetes sp.]
MFCLQIFFEISISISARNLLLITLFFLLAQM